MKSSKRTDGEQSGCFHIRGINSFAGIKLVQCWFISLIKGIMAAGRADGLWKFKFFCLSFANGKQIRIGKCKLYG